MADPFVISDESRTKIRHFALRYDVLGLIQRVMRDRGISARHLAKFLEISKRRMDRIFEGEENISLDTLSDIADFLGCEIIVFMPAKEE